MADKILRWIRGFIICQVSGRYVEIFLNLMVRERMELWNIRRRDDRLVFSILVEDFFRLRPLLKRTGCRLRIMKRFGFPFLIKRLTRRQFFLFGAASFVIILVILTSMIWQVEVDGNEKVPTNKIEQVAARYGIYRGNFIFRLPDVDHIQNGMIQSFPEVSWVGIQREGTKITIKVVEKTRPEQTERKGPQDIVAAKDATIYAIFAKKGIPKVKVNQRVKKGDVLISGSFPTLDAGTGSDAEDESKPVRPVTAEGEVLGIVWYQTKVTVPLIQQTNSYTGNVEQRHYIVAGNRKIKVDGFHDIPFAHYQTEQYLRRLMWGEREMPFGWLTETIRETEETKTKITVEEAVQIGQAQVKESLREKTNEGKIIVEKILQRKIQHDKVILTIYTEVVENIAKERPIIYRQEEIPNSP